MNKNTLIEIDEIDINRVAGGNAIISFSVGYIAGKLIDSYIDWVSNGADGWTEDYNGTGYNDPLL